MDLLAELGKKTASSISLTFEMNYVDEKHFNVVDEWEVMNTVNITDSFKNTKVHSAVLPYFLPLPQILNLGVGRTGPKNLREAEN